MRILDWLKRRVDIEATKSDRPWRDFIIRGGILRTKEEPS
jgi:hypothetical protein